MFFALSCLSGITLSAMKTYRKKDYPLPEIRRYLEPGPISSPQRGGQNEHHDHGLAHDDAIHSGAFWLLHFRWQPQLRDDSEEPRMRDQSAHERPRGGGRGNRQHSGAKIDKFQKFRLTAVPGDKVDAPLIEECYTNFECRLADGRLISKYEFFIWEVAKAHVAVSSKYPKTLHSGATESS